MHKILYILLFLFVSACSSKENNTNSDLQFYYYPGKNVYYSVASQRYFYSLDGAKTWDSLDIESENDLQTLGDKVTLFSPVPNIWQQNNQHREKYNGSLVNIPSTDTTLIANATSKIGERKPTRKPVPTRTVAKKQEKVEKPEKKGVRGFFKNIFGKNKKDKN